MKKSLLYSCALLTLAFVGCDNNDEFLGIEQVNPQGPQLSGTVISSQLASAVAGSSLNLANYASLDAEGVPMSYDNVPVLTYTVDQPIPENAEVYFVMQMASSSDFSNMVELDAVTLEGQQVGISCKAWDDAFRAMFGKAPFAKENYIRFEGYMVNDGEIIRLGGQDYYYGQTHLSVTPIDLNIKIEDAYYLIGTIDGWSLIGGVKFEHSDASPYDDPVFSISFEVTLDDVSNGGFYWKIVPQSVVDKYNQTQQEDWSTLFGPAKDGDTAMSGLLVNDAAGAGLITTAGQYLFKINMLDQSYDITNAIPSLWTPGGGNGWGFGSGELTTNDFISYGGFTILDGDFKLTDRAAWGGLEWSKGAEEGTIELGAPGNIPGPATKGVYWLNVNLGSLTYSYYIINNIGIIGGFPSNNWSSDYVQLSNSTANPLVYTGQITFPGGDVEWKFRANQNWDDVSLGGPLDNLNWHNGPNMASPGAGTYTVTLDLSKVPYTATFTAN